MAHWLRPGECLARGAVGRVYKRATASIYTSLVEIVYAASDLAWMSMPSYISRTVGLFSPMSRYSALQVGRALLLLLPAAAAALG